MVNVYPPSLGKAVVGDLFVVTEFDAGTQLSSMRIPLAVYMPEGFARFYCLFGSSGSIIPRRAMQSL